MKVFAMGLDEKAAAAAEEAKESCKIPVEAPKQIVLAGNPKRRGCSALTWVVAAFCVVVVCLSISELAYHRQRDQALFRLKWAELRQRMLGYELLSQQQDIDRMMLEKAREEPKNREPAVSSAEQPEEDNKLGFLKNLLENIRKHAQEMGMSGDMQVHVLQVRPVENPEPVDEHEQRALADGFGEFAMPKQDFSQDYEESHNFDINEPVQEQMLPWQWNQPPPPPAARPWYLPEANEPWMRGPQQFQPNPMAQQPWVDQTAQVDGKFLPIRNDDHKINDDFMLQVDDPNNFKR